MLKKSDISDVCKNQLERLNQSSKGCERQLLSKLDLNLSNHALIISGIRRCGKSTLLHQLIEIVTDVVFYINFDTPKLYNFELSDFQYIDEIIKDNHCKYLFFDEIQLLS